MTCWVFSGANVDRSVKDLQRCAASLTRYRVVVREEMDSSIKKMKQTFAELQSWYIMLTPTRLHTCITFSFFEFSEVVLQKHHLIVFVVCHLFRGMKLEL